MKCVRTEDKIIDVSYLEKDDKGNYYTWESDDFCANRKYIYKEDIIKEADTIEELCDMFVVRKETCRDLLVAKSWAKSYNEILYGAIWTDKGLQYIAKMNDKGELELI